MHRRYGDRGFQVIGMNVATNPVGGSDDRAMLEAFVARSGVTFPIAMRADRHYSTFGQAVPAAPYPLHVVVDAEGIIRYLAHGYHRTALQAVIEALLP